MSSVIDATAFPSILDTILKYAPFESQKKLRATCRAYRERIEAKWCEHVLLTDVSKSYPFRNPATGKAIPNLPWEPLKDNEATRSDDIQKRTTLLLRTHIRQLDVDKWCGSRNVCNFNIRDLFSARPITLRFRPAGSFNGKETTAEHVLELLDVKSEYSPDMIGAPQCTVTIPLRALFARELPLEVLSRLPCHVGDIVFLLCGASGITSRKWWWTSRRMEAVLDDMGVFRGTLESGRSITIVHPDSPVSADGSEHVTGCGEHIVRQLDNMYKRRSRGQPSSTLRLLTRAQYRQEVGEERYHSATTPFSQVPRP